ncbi:unnamed protein product [Cercopithifilaria johnstoni]|uniref:Uncharacterized protein n=1 Tax=Cercopithifilaria johnstoni TaxID=2874296 RepID=A0A8J2MDQ1_9BILA|nr:unnamed protein product [Cercopithifilaria johnstoni]
MEARAKVRVKATKVNAFAEIKKSITRKERNKVIRKRKPAGKTTRSESESQMRKSAKNVRVNDLAGKEEKQANNLPMKHVAWTLDSTDDACRATVGYNTVHNAKEDLFDHAGRKRFLKKTALSKIESEGQGSGASGQEERNIKTMKYARSSGVPASSKEKSASVKKGRKTRTKNFVKSRNSEK